MVPYIDVTLVLLIIFMITAPLLQSGVEVDLPRADAKTVIQEETPPLVVTIDKGGQYFIDVGDRKDEPVLAEQLTLKVIAVVRYKPDTKVMIRGDAEVAYGKVVTVMAALKIAGIPNVGLITRPLEN